MDQTDHPSSQTRIYTREEFTYIQRLDKRFAQMKAYEKLAPSWDAWHERALAAGVSEPLARLGRLVMRDYVHRGWDEVLGTACGYPDDGAELLAFGLAHPESAAHRWQRLLDTDGLRGEWVPDGSWRSWTDVECAHASLDLFPSLLPAPPQSD